ncbi:MAG: hypothetical protein ACE37E_12665 [Hyphomicrobiales bacterium]
MSGPLALETLADWLVRQRFATLDTVWALTLSDVRRAARLAAPSTAITPPTPDDLAALMRAFPDMPPEKEDGHDRHLTR